MYHPPNLGPIVGVKELTQLTPDLSRHYWRRAMRAGRCRSLPRNGKRGPYLTHLAWAFDFLGWPWPPS